MLLISFLIHTVNAYRFEHSQPFVYETVAESPLVPSEVSGRSSERFYGVEDYKEDSWDFTPNIVVPTIAPSSHSRNMEGVGRATFELVNSSALRESFSTKPERPATTSPASEKSSTNNVYEINFCNKHEFTDQLLATYGLERLDNFIWNTSCSQTFFQCSIGQTFVFRCPSENQAFDRSITNCNFRNAVEVCPEFDRVLHCSIQESCTEMEFACCSVPQRCISISMRCDGHRDCGDGDDENNCPSCSRYEFACVKSGKCIPAEKRCDGISDDCQDGTNLDELGCSRNSTCLGKFMCDQSQQGPQCIEWSDHCNGVKNCMMGEDEKNCKSQEAKFLSCENQKQLIPKQNWCDGKAHCADGSDEKYCH
ncbi:hypothetical protein RB195_012700 [Necator americanus]|uniref:Chitin-binding type-2 domain-containing protein n=1 Tax=Necator americanus TaxID=51031 RepID=A0ABR1DS61_NECAM